MQMKKLVRSNLSDFKKGIDTGDLPKTFQDMIYLVERLGHRYLWIDSLCIIQDDPQDWATQSSRMADIYRGSWCNIAATGAADASHGLFGLLDRFPTPLEPLCVQVQTNSIAQQQDFSNDDEEPLLFERHPRDGQPWLGFASGRYEIVDRDLWYNQVNDSPLGRRAWIVQERLLAPRVLHFANDQLFWECNQLKACELYPFDRLGPVDLLGTADLKSEGITSGYDYPPEYATITDWNDIGLAPQILQSWGLIVAAYSRASLTYDRDRLPALLGLADSFQDRIKAPYLAGLFAVQLHRQLLWSVYALQRPPTLKRVPSWCWPSVNGDIRSVVAIQDQTERRLATILTFNMEGEIWEQTGSIVVRGRLIPCTLSLALDAASSKCCNPMVRGLDCAAYVLPDISIKSELVTSLVSTARFFCLPTLIFRDATEPTTPEIAGLVLASTGERGEFRRFGAFRTDNAMDRDGDVHPDWIYDKTIQPRQHTQPGRVFLMDVEDERKEVAEESYEKYERDDKTNGFGNFVFSII